MHRTKTVPRSPYRPIGLLGLAALLALLVPLTACDSRSAASATTDPVEAEELLGSYPVSRFLIRPDLFLPSLQPGAVPGRDARFLKPDGEVFGVKLDGRVRAYPITMIGYYHVANDSIGRYPLAVTY